MSEADSLQTEVSWLRPRLDELAISQVEEIERLGMALVDLEKRRVCRGDEKQQDVGRFERTRVVLKR